MVTFTNNDSSSQVFKIRAISNLIIVLLFLWLAISIFYLTMGSYKIFIKKNKKEKLVGRWQLVIGFTMLMLLLLVWYVINLMGTYY